MKKYPRLSEDINKVGHYK